MIDYELYCRIKDHQDNRHLTVPQIARELDLDERTVAHWLAVDKFQPRQVTARPSKLDPYKKQIVRVLPAELKKAKSPPGVVAVQGNQAAERTPPVDMTMAKG
jgi:hypothetical protein